jgi:hypothetical protein
MRGREWISGPAWNCFRTEFRRRWRGRNTARALGMLGLLAALQFAVSVEIMRFWPRLGTLSDGIGLGSLMDAFGLFSPLAFAFTGGAVPAILPFLLVQGIAALPWQACHFLMPAYAAASIAPDREQRRIPDLILAGLTPRQILVAKGMAAVLPFMVAAAAGEVVSGVAFLLQPGAEWMSSYLGVSPLIWRLAMSGMSAIDLLVGTAMLICISALSSRTTRAMVLCYSVQFLLTPILYLLCQLGWLLTLSAIAGKQTLPPKWAGILTWFGPLLTVLLLQAVALLLLWPRALRALAYPDEVYGGSGHSMALS